MNVTVEALSSVKKKLVIELPADMVDARIEEGFVSAGKSAKLKGFRPGKVPRAVLENLYGDQVKAEAAQGLINDSYFKAAVENKVPIVSRPLVTETSEIAKGEPFSYTCEVEVKPEVELQGYKGLEFDREILDFDEARVDNQLEQMRQTRATMEPADREVCQNGDFVIIDFVGYKGDEKFDNGSAENYTLELGSSSFIPGFEEAIVGMKTGEQKSIDLTFPENYGAKDLAGQAVRFEVTLKEIKVKVAPEWTDELAKEFSAESVEALRTKIGEAMAGEDESRVRHEFEDRVRAALVEKNPLEVPEAMVDAELEAMLTNFRNNIRMQGMSMEMLGMTPERFNSVYREAAVSRVKSTLILEAIGREEEISVTEEDLDAKMQTLAERTKTDLTVVQNHFKNPEARKALQFETFEEKVVAAVVAAGKVNELSREALQEKQQAAEADKE